MKTSKFENKLISQTSTSKSCTILRILLPVVTRFDFVVQLIKQWVNVIKLVKTDICTYPICGVRPSPFSKTLLRSFSMVKVVRAAIVVVNPMLRSKDEKQSTAFRCIFISPFALFRQEEWILQVTLQMSSVVYIYLYTFIYFSSLFYYSFIYDE